MDSNFSLSVGSDQDYEDLIAEVYYEGAFLCLISQDDGFDTLDIEIHPRNDGQPWRFKLDEFQKAVNDARQRLWELRRIK